MRIWWVVGLAMGLPGALPAQAQPEWVLSQAAKNGFADLWDASTRERRELVACLGGSREVDTVRVLTLGPLDLEQSDSLTAEALGSIERCGPPDWIGTIHTHIRSTDDERPAPRFSPSDRVVMSEWVARWGAPGAFCVLYSDRAAQCEVYPPLRGSTEP
ncbi:MAG: hypothetical protein SF070_16690 [Gemmatimonadota bacterium]|nr:hypothetical protein [Gemmatimonadota bacterium]